MGRRDSDHRSARHQNDQAPFGAGHIEIGTHLSPIVIKRLRGGIHVASPVDHDGWPAYQINRNRVRDAHRRNQFGILLLKGIDRKFSEQ